MMNKLVLSLSLSLLPHSVYAAEELGQVASSWACYDFEELRQSLREEHGEVPFISGNGASLLLNRETEEFEIAPNGFYVFANPETYKFSVVFRIKSNLGCIAAAGTEIGPVIQDQGI